MNPPESPINPVNAGLHDRISMLLFANQRVFSIAIGKVGEVLAIGRTGNPSFPVHLKTLFGQDKGCNFELGDPHELVESEEIGWLVRNIYTGYTQL